MRFTRLHDQNGYYEGMVENCPMCGEDFLLEEDWHETKFCPSCSDASYKRWQAQRQALARKEWFHAWDLDEDRRAERREDIERAREERLEAIRMARESRFHY